MMFYRTMSERNEPPYRLRTKEELIDRIRKLELDNLNLSNKLKRIRLLVVSQ